MFSIEDPPVRNKDDIGNRLEGGEVTGLWFESRERSPLGGIREPAMPSCICVCGDWNSSEYS